MSSVTSSTAWTVSEVVVWDGRHREVAARIARDLRAAGNVVEADLEEIYYYRIDKPDGFAYQRIYTDPESPLHKAGYPIDEVLLAREPDDRTYQRVYALTAVSGRIALDEAETVLEELLTESPRDPDLLLADAFLTYACEAALDNSEDPAPALERLVVRAAAPDR